MKIETKLDHQLVLANSGRPVLGAIQLQGSEISDAATTPAAICLVWDKSGAETSRRLVRNFIRHWPEHTLFAFVAFGEEADCFHELGQMTDRTGFSHFVQSLESASTCGNVASGWLLAREQLRRAPIDLPRKIILITDATPPAFVHDGATEGIRTSIVTADADLNRIVATELGGLRPVVAHNARLRLKALQFCEGIEPLGFEGHEVNLGDFVSGEEKTVCFNITIPEFPCIDGTPVATLENEEIFQFEVIYDEVTAHGIESRRFEQTIYAQSEQPAGRAILTAPLLPLNFP